MKKLFGTNGVRGVFSEDFTLEFVNDLVMSLAAHFKQGKILVGYDGRHSSPIVAKVVSSALNYSGLDCYMAGLVPTPCLEYATKKLGYDGGLMITASHNPPQYNGIKPVASDGVEISEKYNNLYEISGSEVPKDIQDLIDNEDMGLAMLRIVEVIGQTNNCTYCGVFRRQAL